MNCAPARACPRRLPPRGLQAPQECRARPALRFPRPGYHGRRGPRVFRRLRADAIWSLGCRVRRRPGRPLSLCRVSICATRQSPRHLCAYNRSLSHLHKAALSLPHQAAWAPPYIAAAAPRTPLYTKCCAPHCTVSWPTARWMAGHFPPTSKRSCIAICAAASSPTASPGCIVATAATTAW
jgi:hypothetical protein